MPTTLITSN